MFPPHIELCSIPGGTLLLGSEQGRDDERPVRSVVVAPFRLGRTQVTNAEYDHFVSATSHVAAPFRSDSDFASPLQPVVGVSWFDATSFCEWLTQETELRFRLPTEPEWEWAARGERVTARYPWGEEPFEVRYPDHSSLWTRGPEVVGKHESNSFGLFEMCENVHEWCAGWYDPDTQSRRASRGGSWRHQIKISTCSARSSIPPSFRYSDYGFRVARTG